MALFSSPTTVLLLAALVAILSMRPIVAFQSSLSSVLFQRRTALRSSRISLSMTTQQHQQQQQSSSYSSTISAQTPVPRAAVSVVVRFHNTDGSSSGSSSSTKPAYLLIERGNPPNQGVWCVPGGKIEMGEPTLDAAQRELSEEVKFAAGRRHDQRQEATSGVKLAWYSGAFCTSDSIIPVDAETGQLGYHYLIAQCFAEILTSNDDDKTGSSTRPPRVEPADDAVGAKWWTLDEIREAEAKKETVPNLAVVIERAEALYHCGMLPTTHSVTVPTVPN